MLSVEVPFESPVLIDEKDPIKSLDEIVDTLFEDRTAPYNYFEYLDNKVRYLKEELEEK